MLQRMKESQGVKTLTKLEQKKITGGDGNGGGAVCSMTYQAANGQWIEEIGTCQLAYYGSAYGINVYRPYCKTESYSGPVPLTSNGGVSKCGPLTTLAGILAS